jgi:hypothetical protein
LFGWGFFALKISPLYWHVTCTQKNAQIISIQLNDFPTK